MVADENDALLLENSLQGAAYDITSSSKMTRTSVDCDAARTFRGVSTRRLCVMALNTSDPTPRYRYRGDILEFIRDVVPYPHLQAQPE